MITIKFPDADTELEALGFLLGRFPGRALKTGEVLAEKLVRRDGKRFTSVESTLQMWTQQFVMGSGRHARQERKQDALEKKVREVRTEVVAGNLVRIGYLRRRFYIVYRAF